MRISTIALLSSALLLGGCQQYELTLNDQLVYTPKPLLTDYQMADIELRKCLDDTIKEEKITTTNQLTQLYCVKQGVKDTEGLVTFRQLRTLDLSGNGLSNLVALGQVTSLKQLNLTDNQITSAAFLKTLPKLRFVSLQNNPQLQCDTVKTFNQNVEVVLPEHCIE